MLCRDAGIAPGVPTVCKQGSLDPVCVVDTDPCAREPCRNGGGCSVGIRESQNGDADACGCTHGLGWSGSAKACVAGKRQTQNWCVVHPRFLSATRGGGGSGGDNDGGMQINWVNPDNVVAGEAIKRFNPLVEVEAIHGNIKDSQFHVDWFRGFDAVINALDNVDARRHVNRMCLAADKPLIEAGTTGFLGQVFCIRKGETACYECFPKPQRVVYPICTIRSTPSQPVHCVVWAKELFKLLFGDASASMLFDDPAAEGEPSSSVWKSTSVSGERGGRHGNFHTGRRSRPRVLPSVLLPLMERQRPSVPL